METISTSRSEDLEREIDRREFSVSRIAVAPTIIALVISGIFLIAVNSSVLYYFFGNATRTDTSHLLQKTELYKVEQSLHAKIDTNAKEIEQLVEKHAFSVNQEIMARFSQLSKVLDNMMSEYDSELATLKAAIPEKELDELVASFEKLRERVDEVDIRKPNVTYVYEADVTDLLDPTYAGKTWRSEFIFCRGISWYLSYTNRNDFLNVYLHPNNPETTPWRVNTDFKITILNQSDKVPVSHRRRWMFSDKHKTGHGFPDFISMKRLKNEGFIKDNKIQLKLELVAEKLIRDDAPAKLS